MELSVEATSQTSAPPRHQEVTPQIFLKYQLPGVFFLLFFKLVFFQAHFSFFVKSILTAFSTFRLSRIWHLGLQHNLEL